MIKIINSICISGVTGLLTTVETYVTPGIREFSIIGLAGASVKESKNRVCAAVKNCGFDLPKGRITVNLAPSDIRKEGTGFDLAIAAGILAAGGYIDDTALDRYVLVGELSLDGMVKPVSGLFSMCVSASREGIKDIVIPEGNIKEVMSLEGVRIWPVKWLSDLIGLSDREKSPPTGSLSDFCAPDASFSISEIKGHKTAKRAVEIAASGRHNILMLGAVGSGKTMLAHSIRSILPPLERNDIYDVTSIYSLCGLLNDDLPVVRYPPFREVHTGVTKTALIGGGRPVVPGEISLAHRGVLFLDEVTEIDRGVIDSLRQPMDSGDVTVSRVGHIEKLPADFMLICAMNPCRCGNLLEGPEKCTCTPKMISHTLEKISRPILDRIDIHIPVKTPGYSEIQSDRCEPDEVIRERVRNVRNIQKEKIRQHGFNQYTYSRLSGDELDDVLCIEPEAEEILLKSAEQLSLSIRAFNKLKAISGTISDMNGHGSVKVEDMAEAVQYRIIDRKLFREGGVAVNAA